MDCEELEQNLNQVIQALVDGLNGLAAQTRQGGCPDDVADSMEQLAASVCMHWPNCFTSESEEEESAL